jgi:hypothetical protein
MQFHWRKLDKNHPDNYEKKAIYQCDILGIQAVPVTNVRKKIRKQRYEILKRRLNVLMK